MKKLIGHKITNLFVSEDESILSFVTESGKLINYTAISDCCSETWFADIIGVNNLLGFYVADTVDLKVDECVTCGKVVLSKTPDIPMHYNVMDNRSRQEVDLVYGVRIYTTMGYTTIIFRNSSNGFYTGGYALLTQPIKMKMRPIKSDWSA